MMSESSFIENMYDRVEAFSLYCKMCFKAFTSIEMGRVNIQKTTEIYHDVYNRLHGIFIETEEAIEYIQKSLKKCLY